MATREQSRATESRDAQLEHSLLLAQALDDFTKFCGLLDIEPKAGGGVVPFRLSPIQKKYCQSRTARDIILKPRQIWMTTVELARDVWKFVARKGQRVVVVCQSDQGGETLNELCDRVGVFLLSLAARGLRIEYGREAAGLWTIPANHSSLRIVGAGASLASAMKKGRGQTITRLHVTEAAFFEHPAATFNGLMESVAGPEFGSEVVTESTANGAGGYFYDQWQLAVRGANGFKPHFFPWWDHPEYRLPLEPGEVVSPVLEHEKDLVDIHKVSSEQLKWYRAKLASKNNNLDEMIQEYPNDPETCFLVSGRTFFDMGRVDGMARRASSPVETLEHGALRIWMPPVRGRSYVISVDTAEGEDVGKDKDFDAALVLDRANGKHMATLWIQVPPWELAGLLAQLAIRYNGAEIAVERNNHGGSVIQALVKGQEYRNLYVHHEDRKVGWPTSPITRPRMLDHFADAVRNGHFVTPDILLLGEMRVFIVNKHGRPEGQSGKHDDLVMAAAIGWEVICRPRTRRDMSAINIL